MSETKDVMHSFDEFSLHVFDTEADLFGLSVSAWFRMVARWLAEDRKYVPFGAMVPTLLTPKERDLIDELRRGNGQR